MKHFSALLRGWPTAGLLLILLMLAGPAVRAQTAWQSAIALGSSSYSLISATATDASGNVYMSGTFRGMVGFGSIMLSSTGGEDAFIAKWNPAMASFEWAQQLGGADMEGATAIAVSGTKVYVAGQFRSSTMSVGNVVLTNANTDNTDDIFVARLDATGSFEWAQRAGGSSRDVASSLCVTANGVYIAGAFFSPTATFGNTTLTNSPGFGYDAFVARLTESGASASFAWVQQIGGTGDDYATALAAVGPAVYITGQFDGPVLRLGALTLANANVSQPATDDIFVAKLVDAGSGSSFAWAQRAGSTARDAAYALAAQGSSVYVTGSIGYPLNGAASTGASFGNSTLTSAGSDDMFVTKLIDGGNTGSFAWAQRAGGAGVEGATAIAAIGTEVYLTGYFASPAISFGATTTLINSNPSPAGYKDIFVTKLTDTGSGPSFAWARQAGGMEHDESLAIAVSNTSIYVAGASGSPTVRFGGLTLTNPLYTYVGFLTSLTNPILATTASEETLAFTLAPNPARTATTVQLPALPGTTSATLTLRDALGRAICTATVALPAAGLRHEFDLTSLPAGIYALQVQAGAATATRRLVVE